MSLHLVISPVRLYFHKYDQILLFSDKTMPLMIFKLKLNFKKFTFCTSNFFSLFPLTQHIQEIFLLSTNIIELWAKALSQIKVEAHQRSQGIQGPIWNSAIKVITLLNKSLC